MEDAHAAVLELDGPGDKTNTFFAVYDGHGGEFFFMISLTSLINLSEFLRIKCGSVCGTECA